MSRTFLTDISFAGGDAEAAPNGDIQLISGVANLKQALNHRLITVKGSLVHRPNYGIGAQSYVNKIARLDTQRELSSEIRRQFREDKRVSSVNSVSFTMKDNGLFIVKYSITAVGIGNLTFSEEIGGI